MYCPGRWLCWYVSLFIVAPIVCVCCVLSWFDGIVLGCALFSLVGIFTFHSIETASDNSVESDLGCTSRIYFDNVTLTLHNNVQNCLLAGV